MNQSDLLKINKIIKRYFEVLMYISTGQGKPSSALLKELNLPPDFEDLVTNSYKLGKLKLLEDVNFDTLTYEQAVELLKKMKLTKTQENALTYIKNSAGNRITALGDKVKTSIVDVAIKSEMSMLQGVRTVLDYGLYNNKTRQEVASVLRVLTQDWERDWQRVAHTEMWEAHLQGEAMAILGGESSLTDKKGDTLVFKRPGPNACVQCKKLYLEADGVTPKIFVLTELMQNGDNRGRKTAEWLPTLGVLHPNCMCTLSIMPDGYVFDSQGQLVQG